MVEIWKDVVGYEGLYQVSNLGRVRSLPKMVGFRSQPEKLIAIFADKHGYHKTNLYKHNTHKQVYVHMLVAQAFIPNDENKPQVNHKDGDKSHNFDYNLEWCTAKENIIHAYSNGLKHDKKGVDHPMYGKKHSLETRKKLSEASKRRWSEVKCGS